MAKVPYSKLNLKKKENVQTLVIGDDNIEIEVKQYLPIEDKIKIVTNVLQNSADDNNFANPIKVDVFTNLEIIYNYTNISFTEKQKENPEKLFDILEENNVILAVIGQIPESEYCDLISWIQETIDAFYKYRNSAMGVLEQVSADYSNLNFDATAIQEKIADPANLELLKNIVTKLG